MPAQVFLIVPPEAPAAAVKDRLMPMLAGSEVPAMLIERGGRTAEDYQALVLDLLPLAQQAGTAVLIEGDATLVQELGADGLHVEGDLAAVEHAIDALKPDLIVGVKATALRDDAMSFGEREVDYLFFGPETANREMSSVEMAEWWAETMEIPCVLATPDLDDEVLQTTRCEFVAARDLFAAPDPTAALARLVSILGGANG
jgi:thiamine-phosphate pyrophosphorylase